MKWAKYTLLRDLRKGRIEGDDEEFELGVVLGDELETPLEEGEEVGEFDLGWMGRLMAQAAGNLREMVAGSGLTLKDERTGRLYAGDVEAAHLYPVADRGKDLGGSLDAIQTIKASLLSSESDGRRWSPCSCVSTARRMEQDGQGAEAARIRWSCREQGHHIGFYTSTRWMEAVAEELHDAEGRFDEEFEEDLTTFLGDQDQAHDIRASLELRNLAREEQVRTARDDEEDEVAASFTEAYTDNVVDIGMDWHGSMDTMESQHGRKQVVWVRMMPIATQVDFHVGLEEFIGRKWVIKAFRGGPIYEYDPVPGRFNRGRMAVEKIPGDPWLYQDTGRLAEDEERIDRIQGDPWVLIQRLHLHDKMGARECRLARLPDGGWTWEVPPAWDGAEPWLLTAARRSLITRRFAGAIKHFADGVDQTSVRLRPLGDVLAPFELGHHVGLALATVTSQAIGIDVLMRKIHCGSCGSTQPHIRDWLKLGEFRSRPCGKDHSGAGNVRLFGRSGAWTCICCGSIPVALRNLWVRWIEPYVSARGNPGVRHWTAHVDIQGAYAVSWMNHLRLAHLSHPAGCGCTWDLMQQGRALLQGPRGQELRAALRQPLDLAEAI